jgi:thioredoxin 1
MKVVISKINVDKNPELTAQFKVRSIPALLYFKNGEIVDTQNGVQSKSVMTSNLASIIKAKISKFDSLGYFLKDKAQDIE